MKNIKKAVLASAVSASVFSVPAMAEDTDFMSALKDGKASLSFRYRMEDVSQDTKNDAMANTLRTRLNFQSGAYKGFSGFVEFDQVSELLDTDNYSTPGNIIDNQAVIADPEVTDLNQAYGQYAYKGTTARYGRQRINLDNQRFIGGVGWRQNEQTFDAFSIKNTDVEKLTLFYAYIRNVNTITGANAYAKDHLVNAQYKFSDAFVATGYGYLLDKKDTDDANNDTVGVSLTGTVSAFEYRAEYAQQSAYKGGVAYDAPYMHLKGDYKVGGVKLGLGYEVLGADGADGEFETPYATKHAFNGWADTFLNTPDGGLNDLYASIGGKMGPVTGAFVYHQYTSDDDSVGPGDLGSEIGVVLKGKAGPVALLAKYADYSADDYGLDTQKLWLMASMSF